MARKKYRKLSGLKLEAISWEDAETHTSEKINDELTNKLTVGFVVRETDKAVVLAHDMSHSETWEEEDADFTKIPKSLILQRFPFGNLPEEADAEPT